MYYHGEHGQKTNMGKITNHCPSCHQWLFGWSCNSFAKNSCYMYD